MSIQVIEKIDERQVVADFCLKENSQYQPQLACEYGCLTAIILTELVQKQMFFLDNSICHQVYGNGWFYATIEGVFRKTGIGRTEQEEILAKLRKFSFIEMAVFGTPARRHFRINFDKIYEDFCKRKILINYKLYKNSSKKTHDFPVCTAPERELAVQASSKVKKVIFQKNILDCKNREKSILGEKSSPLSSSLNTKKKKYNKEKERTLDAAAFSLANFFFQQILNFLPDFKNPNMNKWHKIFDKMIHEDGRTPEEIKNYISWCTTEGCWWQGKILYPEKLRKHWNVLTMQMKPPVRQQVKEKNYNLATRISNEAFSETCEVYVTPESMSFIPKSGVSPHVEILKFSDADFMKKLEFNFEKYGFHIRNAKISCLNSNTIENRIPVGVISPIKEESSLY